MSSRAPVILMTAASIAFACLTGGCSGGPGAPSPVPSSAVASPVPSPSPSTGPAALVELVLRVTTEGGFVGPAAHLAQLPAVVVYADGRILTPAPVPAIYPGPLLPVELVRNVGAAGIAAIRAAITAAGLDTGGGTSSAIVPDAADTVFAVRVGVQTVNTRFQALGIGGPGPGGPGASSDPRRTNALALLARLTDPTDTWGGQASDATQHVPTAYRIFVVPGAPAGSDSTPQHPVAWPLTPPLASFGTPAQPDRGISGLRVGVVSVADAAILAPVLTTANQLTAFTSDGASFTLYVSPLLPDEVAR